MKLRVRGNSLRLRLTRAEVDRLRSGGRVEERVCFGPTSSLTYSIERQDVRDTRAELEGLAVRVVAPNAVVDAWATSEAVGFDADQRIGDGDVLRILVEKDWNCLTSRPGEEDVDTFPNPNKTC